MTSFKCAGCEKTFSKEDAKKHTKNGGICTTAYPVNTFFADKHEVDQIQDDEDPLKNKKSKDQLDKEKRVKELEGLIAKAEEDERKEMLKKSPEELDEILESLTAELEELKKQKSKKSKEARKKYDVLAYNNYDFQSSSYPGDELIQSRGSV